MGRAVLYCKLLSGWSSYSLAWYAPLGSCRSTILQSTVTDPDWATVYRILDMRLPEGIPYDFVISQQRAWRYTLNNAYLVT